ncbi:hypothetical protein CBS101457_001687 [Exobasidium rhododendri]|nr:hypothetical protein CBS101457_001687 [Exobasidium rhododendri]
MSTLQLCKAHCYVHTTSTARGISLGIIPASERERSVNVIGSNQPHFELMGVKIPLMKVGKSQEWRGISQGQVVGPDNAFRYISKSMQQTLPAIMGSLMLLADSFATSSGQAGEESGLYDLGTSTELLHRNAYSLYTQFRPSTSGEWGKKSTFYCGKALALRRGRDEDMRHWEQVEENGGGVHQQSEIEAFEQELQNLVKQESGNVVVKAEEQASSSDAVIKEEDPF